MTDFFHKVIEAWIGSPDITVACGRWSEGAIGELIPEGRARLLPPIYNGCFSGIRELHIEGAYHHLHIDLNRVHRVRYVVAPSICFGNKPSFEARLLVLGPGGTPSDHWVVSLMLSRPYDRGTLNVDRVIQFFELARSHGQSRPDLVDFEIDAAVLSSPTGPLLQSLLRGMTGLIDGDWDALSRAVCPAPKPAQGASQVVPRCIPLLERALRLREASLVIYRERTLIEFKTQKLDGLHRYVEQGHVSWQIGAFAEHHCHLSMDAVSRVLFSAEPVSCQGGGLNYTVWFLTTDPCGNPYRKDGYFSITLNRPYTGNQPRLEVIQPIFDLYREFESHDWVAADHGFLEALTEGPPKRQKIPSRSRPGAATRDRSDSRLKGRNTNGLTSSTAPLS